MTRRGVDPPRSERPRPRPRRPGGPGQQIYPAKCAGARVARRFRRDPPGEHDEPRGYGDAAEHEESQNQVTGNSDEAGLRLLGGEQLTDATGKEGSAADRRGARREPVGDAIEHFHGVSFGGYLKCDEGVPGQSGTTRYPTRSAIAATRSSSPVAMPRKYCSIPPGEQMRRKRARSPAGFRNVCGTVPLT